MENIACTIFRDRGIPDEATFQDLEKSTVQNEAFNRIRGMLTGYSQVSIMHRRGGEECGTTRTKIR